MSWKKFNSILVTTALVSSSLSVTAAAEETKSFVDVKEGHPFYKEIKTLTDKGIINGFPDQTFRPDVPLTRSQVSSLLSRALKLEIGHSIVTYKDVQADSTMWKEVSALISKGVITNTKDTHFFPYKPLTRDIMASWLVRSFGLKSVPGVEVPLKDLNKIDKEHVENVKILYQNGITMGNKNGTYGPNDPVTRGQFATFMFRAMHQVESVEALTPLTLDLSEVTNLPKTVKVKYKSGDLVDVPVKWDTEKHDLTKSGTFNLTGTIEGVSKNASLVVKVEDQPLQVQEFSVLGLKQIVFKVNHTRYNEAALKQAENYKFTDSTIKIGEIDVNGKTVTLTLQKPAENNSRSLLFMGKELFPTDHQIDVAFTDATAPTIQAIEPYSKNKIKVVFSEAIDLEAKSGEVVTNRNFTSAFQLKGNNAVVKEITAWNSGKEVIIEYKDAIKEGNYSFQFGQSLKDFASLPLQTGALPFAMVYERTKPSVVKVKDVYPTQFTVEFNREVSLSTLANIEKYFHHTNKGINAESVYKKSATELVVVFNEKNPIPANAVIFIEPNVVTDSWGNTSFPVETTGLLQADQVPPSIQSVELLPEEKASGKNIELKVSFSEPVNVLEASNLANYNLVDDKNNPVTIKQVSQESKNSKQHYIITVDKLYGEFTNSSYLLQVANIRDLFGNGNATLPFTFQAGSEKAPGDFKANLIEMDNRVTIAIQFNEKMSTSGQYSVLDLAKYELTANGTSYLLDALNQDENYKLDVIHYDNGRAEITINKIGSKTSKFHTFFTELQKSIKSKDLSKLGLTIAMVADESGNTTKSFSNKISLGVQSTFTVAEKVAAVNEDEIKLKFADQIDHFNPMDFILFADQNGDHRFQSNEQLYPNDVLINHENGVSTVTLKLAGNNILTGDAKLNKKKLFISTVTSPETTNLFSQKLTLAQQEIVDQIVAKIQKDGSKDKVFVESNKDSKTATVNLHFTEDIDPNTVTRLSFIVGNGKYEVESVKADKNVVSLTVKLNGAQLSELIGQTVEQKAPFTDLNNNLVSGIQAKIEK